VKISAPQCICVKGFLGAPCLGCISLRRFGPRRWRITLALQVSGEGQQIHAHGQTWQRGG